LRERIALALDVPLPEGVLSELSEVVGVLKIGWPIIVELGLDRVAELVRAGSWVEVIADLKLADIYETMSKVVSKLGFADSFIAHSFVGVEGALGPLKRELDAKGKGLYLVLSMSHPGWNDGFYSDLLPVVRSVSPKGVVVGATKPEMISRVRADLGSLKIISPGVGAQGAKPGSALCRGADVEIVGRRIYSSRDPVREAVLVVEEARSTLSEC
jgi:orotidine-5'-phosphate decarboxylase